MPHRRIAIGAGITVLLLTAVTTAAWFWWIPSAIRDRLREAAARRGLDASVAGIHVGLGGVELTGVELVGASALMIRVGRVEAGAGIVSLASSGTAAIQRLRLEEVRVSTELDDEALGTVLRALRGEGGTEERPISRRRSIDVEGLEIVLRDGEGDLLVARSGQVSLLPDGVLSVAVGPVELAPGAEDHVSIANGALRLEQTSEGWRVAAASIADAEVHYRERNGEERSPFWARLRRHADRVASIVQHDGRAAEAASDEGDSESPRPTENESREDGVPLATTDRTPEAGANLPDEGTVANRGEADRGADASSGSSAGLPVRRSSSAWVVRALEGLEPRLGPNATLRIEDLSVTVHDGAAERSVLHDLEAEVAALSGGRYRWQGSGHPGRGGRLGWDLTVDPSALRAEGRVDFQRVPFVLVVPFLPRLPWHHPEDARITGELTIRGDADGSRMHLAGEVGVDDLALSSERIAPDPVRRISVFFSGDADWVPLDRRLEIAQLELGIGEARAVLTGSVEWPSDHYLLDLRATLPPTDCNTAVSAIPADLLADATAFTFTGQIGGQVVARIDSRALDDTVLTVQVADGCRFETAPAIADLRRFEGPFSHRVVEPDGSTFEMETGPGTPQWTPLSEISPFLVHAVLGHEDAGFFHHAGFSTISIRRALVRNLHAGRFVFGASTITMQLVKNVFLHREKTLARKVQEVLLTWWLESAMDKARILELYLNVIEYGPEIYGIRAAAEHYFGRSPSQLGPAESAYLATILPNPKGFHSHWVQGALPASHRRRVARFIQTLGSRGRYDEVAVAEALERIEGFDFHRPGDPLPVEPRPLRGGTAPLPFGEDARLEAAWEEVIGPDDRGAGFDEEDGDAID